MRVNYKILAFVLLLLCLAPTSAAAEDGEAVCSVSYEWIVEGDDASLKKELLNVLDSFAVCPETVTDHVPGTNHTIDVSWKKETNFAVECGGIYYRLSFEGWDNWRYEGGLDNPINGASELKAVSNMIIQGKWSYKKLGSAEYFFELSNTFLDLAPEQAPVNGSFFTVTAPDGIEYRVVYGQMTENPAASGKYVCKFPVVQIGDYTVKAFSGDIEGSSQSISVTVLRNSLSGREAFENVGSSERGCAVVKVSIGNGYGVTLGSIDFKTSYAKEYASPVYHHPTLTVKKLASDTGTALSNVSLELRDGLGDNAETAKNFLNEDLSGVSDSFGTAVFDYIDEGTYYLTETLAPEGYFVGYEIYRVTVKLKDNSPSEALVNGKWQKSYEYDVSAEVSTDGGNNWRFADDEFEAGSNPYSFTLTSTSKKITGKLTIKAEFAGEFSMDTFDGELEVTVEGPNGYRSTFVLTSEYDWSLTMSDLPLGEYTVTQNPDSAEINGYDLEVVCTPEDGKVSFSAYGTVDMSDFTVTKNVTVKNTYMKRFTDDIVYLPDFEIANVRDSDGSAVGGAGFTLYSDEACTNAVRGEIVADEKSGILCFEKLPEGVYYLKQTKAPDTYSPITARWIVTVSKIAESEKWLNSGENAGKWQKTMTYDAAVEPNGGFDGDTNCLTVKNTKYVGTVTVKAEFGAESDLDADSFAGEIMIKVRYGDTAKNVELNKTGGWTYTVENLPLGERITVELVPDESKVSGYLLSDFDAPVSVFLSSADDEAFVTLTNTYEKQEMDINNAASFKVRTVDSDGAPLAGAVFGIYDGSKLVSKGVTDENGTVVFGGFVSAGEYALKSLEAPKYYGTGNAVWTVKIGLESGDPTIELNEEKNIFERIFDWSAGIEPDENLEEGVLTVVCEKLTGKLVITNTVEVSACSVLPVYTFAVDFTDDAFDTIFTLGDGESRTIENIPFGTEYVISVTDPDGEAVSTGVDNRGTVAEESVVLNFLHKYLIKNSGTDGTEDSSGGNGENGDNSDADNNGGGSGGDNSVGTDNDESDSEKSDDTSSSVGGDDSDESGGDANDIPNGENDGNCGADSERENGDVPDTGIKSVFASWGWFSFVALVGAAVAVFWLGKRTE